MKRSAIRGVGVLLLALALALGVRPLSAVAVPAQAQLLENREYLPALTDAVRGAKRRIICVFYLFKVTDSRGNLPRALANELVAAQKRGVQVTVLLEGGKPVGRVNLAAAGILLRGGVSVIYRGGRNTTHVKAASIDDRYVLIGSHNITQAALKHNNELSVLLDSPQLAAQFRTYLERIR